MHDILHKVQQEKQTSLLVTPSWPGSWRAIMADLPIKRSVQLPTSDSKGNTRHIFHKGARHPQYKPDQPTHMRNPKQPIWVHLVQWDTNQ